MRTTQRDKSEEEEVTQDRVEVNPTKDNFEKFPRRSLGSLQVAKLNHSTEEL